MISVLVLAATLHLPTILLDVVEKDLASAARGGAP
jgi:hypothetical protein